MRFGGGGRRKALINITSLIDVVFLLLLFFVVTSTFLERPGLDLTLPAASPTEVARRDEVTVELDADGATWLDGARLQAADLESEIERALAAAGTERVVLEADERVPHGRVVEAMDAARRAGATGLVVATRPREEPVPAP
ncbi:MAG TPA: biopolymer transporter ExbD [Gemmatimonadota bacterium]|nr:biopolymer transporter ExbD [Gemmatimonadota bacterium]